MSASVRIPKSPSTTRQHSPWSAVESEEDPELLAPVLAVDEVDDVVVVEPAVVAASVLVLVVPVPAGPSAPTLTHGPDSHESRRPSQARAQRAALLCPSSYWPSYTPCSSFMAAKRVESMPAGSSFRAFTKDCQMAYAVSHG